MSERRPEATHAARGSSDRGGGIVTEPRRIAAELCADLRRGDLLDPAFEWRVRLLDARDRRWTQELVYGMLRRRSVLDGHLSTRVRGGLARLDPDLIDVLRLGIYQLLHMRSVPPYAAIAQTVELAKERHGIGASKLVNAVLRRLDRERGELELPRGGDPIDLLATTYSHPRWMVARWVARWGAEDTERLLAANNTEAPVVLRPYGTVSEQLEAMLESAGVEVLEVPLVRDSIELGSGVSLTELGTYRQGLFFVQDPASTLVARYASMPAEATVADLCAAPGGKTLELSRGTQGSPRGLVVAGDRSLTRVRRLLSNLQRVDAPNVRVFVGDARRPPLRPVPAVLIDVPCTGTGTFRRHPDARWRLKMSDLAVMGTLQRTILDGAATVVEPGGLLVYSTCSLEPEENDMQIETFLAEHPEWQLEPPPEGAVPQTVLDAGRLRVLPQRHGVDGVFAARLRKSASA